MTTETVTDIATLAPADRALIVLESTKTEEHLLGLVSEASTITDVIDPDGREQAHRLAMKLRNARTTIEKTGKTAREDAQAFSKAVIDEQKRLIAITEGEEKRVLGLRDGYDAKIEAEKAAKAAAEAARVSGIRAKIEGLRALPLQSARDTAIQLEGTLTDLTAFEITEDAFMEFTEEATAVRHQAMGELREMYVLAHDRELAAAALEVERMRLAEVEREANEKLAAERLAMEHERAAMAAERAAMAAERAAFEASKIVLPVVDVPPAIPVHSNGAPMYSTTTFKENGDPIMLDDRGVRSVFCDVDEGEEPEFTPHDKAEEVAAVHGGLRIRIVAMCTADQFSAMAGKVYACGASEFGDTLASVAASLRNGDFDAALAGADFKLLVSFDNGLIDATVNCIDAMEEEMQVAA